MLRCVASVASRPKAEVSSREVFSFISHTRYKQFMHNIHVIIVRGATSSNPLEKLTKSVALPQGYCLIPVNDSFYLSVCGTQPPSVIENFEFLTPEFKAWLAQASEAQQIAYIETDYFGGEGGQGAVVFSEGNCTYGPVFAQDGPINEALRVLGVSVIGEAFDEFDALGLGQQRSTAEWLALTGSAFE